MTKRCQSRPGLRTYTQSLTLAMTVLLAAACMPQQGMAGRRAEVRVLVFNIFAGKDTARTPSLERIASLVRETGADVVLLQEVDRGTRRSGNVDQTAVLASLTGYDSRFGRTIDYGGGEFGIAVLSRWPITRDTMVPYAVEHPEGSSGESYEARGMLAATVEAPWGSFIVVNTHLSAAGGDHYRLQEVGALTREVERETAAGLPLVVGGDFNARPDSEVVRQAVAQGWRDAWIECGDGTPGYTFPVRVPDRRIDYLFLVNDVGCSGGRVAGHGISDHLAVLFTVRMLRKP